MQISKCPACGATVRPGATECPYCHQFFQEQPAPERGPQEGGRAPHCPSPAAGKAQERTQSAGSIAFQGGVLSGAGTVTDTVVTSGWVRPGGSIGTLTIASEFTQTADGTLDIELGGTEPGESDQLAISGNAT